MFILLFFFVLSLNLLLPALLPLGHLTYFAPFLILLYYRKPLSTCLWCSLLCGLVLDLSTSQYRLGLHAFNYSLTTGILYHQKRNFFEDGPSTLPLVTFFFSSLSTGIQMILLSIFIGGISPSWNWVGTDLIIMPACDALYAFLCFTFPWLWWTQRTRRSGEEYFMRR